MTDLENREAFETWYIENYHDGDIFPNNEILDFNGHHNEYQDSLLNMLWESWQASAQRQGFKLAPLEPNKKMLISADNCEIDGKVTAYNIYKAMINAV